MSEHPISYQDEAIRPYLANKVIPDNVQNLLFIADGKYKNFEADPTCSIGMELNILNPRREEPSLIYTRLPILKPRDDINDKSVGYYPAYSTLNPYQRYTYLTWLTDITKSIDIGYVFLFYYGLERHLLLGKYHEAKDMILFLRQYHLNKSFYYYSSNALLMATIVHNDHDTFNEVINSLDESYNSNISLTAKCRLKIDLTPQEIISLSSKVGFKNKHYIKKYPDSFKKSVAIVLKNEYGKSLFPFYKLNVHYARNAPVIFSNYSFPPEIRSPSMPNIIDNTDFKQSICEILRKANELLKNDLK